jgi:pimeloyl-ACP methyl ester carboxylesterase
MQPSSTSATPFTIEISDEVLTDLTDRLARTRFPGDFANEDWTYGTNEDYLRELIEYYLTQFDWRTQERAINAVSHYRATVDGLQLHFVHERGQGPTPIPLIISHGWPETFWDLRKLIGPLSDPAAHGGDPGDAFDVVVPSLPGYGFSTPLTQTGVSPLSTADLWVTLMREILGYDRFAASGGDWGSVITTQLGHKHPEHLYGIFLHTQFPLSFNPGGPTVDVPPGIRFEGGMPAPSEYGADEQGWLERGLSFFGAGSAYSFQQSTFPQTLAYGLNDSPAGLLAWILEKKRAWADTRGDVESRFTKDDLCSALTIYWATGSYGTSARYYYEFAHHPWTRSRDGFPIVSAPTACAVFPEENILMPRRWAERYYNLQQWQVMEAGGHFAPMEEPDAMVGELRRFFRRFR